ncbi:MAG: winged helix-turn-helix domain-containing protein [Phycisphaerae bacterium]|nr:winged helix-turn-helix domain-containing protein [Phycisphaerae bacterium]
MQESEIKIGYHYKCKVTNALVTIQITAKHHQEGWHAINLSTHKKIHIKSAQRLIKPVNSLNELEDEINEKKAQRQQQAIETVKANTVTETKDPDSGQPEPNKAQAKPLSLINAAAKILNNCNSPLSCRDIIAKAIELNLWQPKSGKTPANTLHSAINKEIKTKGDSSCFEKADRGQFILSKKHKPLRYKDLY